MGCERIDRPGDESSDDDIPRMGTNSRILGGRQGSAA